MKKLLNLLLATLMAVTIAACQKPIEAELRFKGTDGREGGMTSASAGNKTLKDLFDAYGSTGDFTYELDEEGYVVSINGTGNDEFGYWAICKYADGLDDPINDTIANITLQDGDVYTVTYIPNEELFGGWEMVDVSRTDLTDEEAEIFEKVKDAYLDDSYVPVRVLATQLVSGMNYAYLVGEKTADGQPLEYQIVKIYKDLQDNVELQSISAIEITDVKTADANDEPVVGGWEIQDTGRPGTLGSSEAQESFDKSTADLDGVIYNPIQLLATQLVAGTNYKALALGKVVGNENHPGLYILTWYEDLDGNCQMTDIGRFDLLSYVE